MERPIRNAAQPTVGSHPTSAADVLADPLRCTVPRAKASTPARVSLTSIPSPSSFARRRFRLAESRRRLLQLALLSAWPAWGVCLAAILLGLSEVRPATWLALGLSGAVLALSQTLLRMEKMVLAARALVLPFAAVIALSMWLHGGLASGSAVLYLPLLVIAAATGGRRLTAVTALAGACALVCFALLDTLKVTLPHQPLPPMLPWIQMILALAICGVMLHGMLRSLRALDHEAEAARSAQQDVEVRYDTAKKLEPVGQLASGVAHDFNNLLSVMASVSAALRQEHETKPGIEELLNDLDEATTRASLMTGQLLSFSQRRTFDPATIDLDELLASLGPLLSRLLGDEIIVSVFGSTEGLTVHADRGQLEQVVLNLAINARDAMPRGGCLDIRLGRDPARDLGVFIELQDTGEGIPPDLREQIFSAFFTTKPTGTGLGLATVKDIVDRLCGSIEVESDVGRGTTFRIALPAGTAAASPPHPSLSRHRVVRSSARILLAEDHELLRRATQRNLEQIGYAVTSVVNGQEALALLQGGATFDLLITDVSMPVLSGIALVEELQRMNLKLPIVFISGNAGLAPSFGDRFSMPTRFLAKPFAQEEFLEAIEKSIAEGRLNGRGLQSNGSLSPRADQTAGESLDPKSSQGGAA